MKVIKVAKKLTFNKSTVSNLEMEVLKGGVAPTGCLSGCPCPGDKTVSILQECNTLTGTVLEQF